MGELHEYLRAQEMLKKLIDIHTHVTANVEEDAIPIDNDFHDLRRWFVKHIKDLEESAE